MKRVILFVAALAAVSTVVAGFKYEGEWPTTTSPTSITIAPNGNVFVAFTENDRIQKFTPTGSFLRQWTTGLQNGVGGISASPLNGNVYAGGCTGMVNYYSPTGSLLGSWYTNLGASQGGEVAPNGNVYLTWSGELGNGVAYYTPTGSSLGTWICPGADVGIAPNGNVYITDSGNDRIRYYTRNGSFIGGWRATDPGEIAVGPDGTVFVVFPQADVIRYFTPSGSLVGSLGGSGSGQGQFYSPTDVAVSRTGARVYVADAGNYRIQYFNRNEPGIAPASLGRVKAVFK